MQEMPKCSFSPWAGKMPWRRAWQPPTVFLPEKSQDRGVWWATVHGVSKSRIQQWLSTHTHLWLVWSGKEFHAPPTVVPTSAWWVLLGQETVSWAPHPKGREGFFILSVTTVGLGLCPGAVRKFPTSLPRSRWFCFYPSLRGKVILPRSLEQSFFLSLIKSLRFCFVESVRTRDWALKKIIYFLVHWVFIAVRRLSLGVTRWGYSLVMVHRLLIEMVSLVEQGL